MSKLKILWGKPGSHLYIKPVIDRGFERHEFTEQEIMDAVNTTPPEVAWYLEITIRGLIGTKTGKYIPPMYSSPIETG